jgi:hypothetical protein
MSDLFLLKCLFWEWKKGNHTSTGVFFFTKSLSDNPLVQLIAVLKDDRAERDRDVTERDRDVTPDVRVPRRL